MKPTDKQLEDIKIRIATARRESALSDAEIGRISNVHPSQVGRICDGSFRTFSNNVVQICNILGVTNPRLEPGAGGADLAWLQAQSSMRRLWDETPDGAKAIIRLLDAIVELQTTRKE
jgi:hypothetical protein